MTISEFFAKPRWRGKGRGGEGSAPFDAIDREGAGPIGGAKDAAEDVRSTVDELSALTAPKGSDSKA